MGADSLHADACFAPPEVWIRYLAVFQRFFLAVLDYNEAGDRAGMLLGGHLADALHNVPAILWRGGAPDATYTPEEINAWLDIVPERMRQYGAPERLVMDSRRILSSENAAQELDLPPDLHDFALPPLPQVQRDLDRLHHACVDMRYMRNYGARPSVLLEKIDNVYDLAYLFVKGKPRTSRIYAYTPWKGLEEVWNEEAQAQAEENRRLADELRNVPKLLFTMQ